MMSITIIIIIIIIIIITRIIKIIVIVNRERNAWQSPSNICVGGHVTRDCRERVMSVIKTLHHLVNEMRYKERLQSLHEEEFDHNRKNPKWPGLTYSGQDKPD